VATQEMYSAAGASKPPHMSGFCALGGAPEGERCRHLDGRPFQPTRTDHWVGCHPPPSTRARTRTARSHSPYPTQTPRAQTELLRPRGLLRGALRAPGARGGWGL
jgi:hypothetical protein